MYNKYGKLELFVGPMFAGKTTTLLKQVIWSKFSGKNVYVFKPARDTRYSIDEVVSHDGLSVVAHNILDASHFPDVTMTDSLIVIDEIQFFGRFNGVIEWIEELLKAGNDVIAVGLDMDTYGIPFETTCMLAGMADEVHKLKAVCSICGSPAAKTFKKIKNNDRIQLGSSDIYESRCNSHWIEENGNK